MKIAVLADDLTGANATGVKLAKQGFSTMTVICGSTPPDMDYDVICFDTDSRYENLEIAKKRLIQAMQSIPEDKRPKIYCKRIDSTLRGNIGIEIDAMLDELGSDSTAIVVAAFPESGRVTIGDFLLVNGLPLQETDVALDPITPLTSSKVSEIIGKNSQKPIASIKIDQVLKGKNTLDSLIRKKIEEGIRVVVIDAISEEQINTIAEVMASLNQLVVAVDPGPLTAAFSKATFGKVNQNNKVLATVGSVTSHTIKQLNDFIDKWKVQPIYVKPHKLATWTMEWQQEVDRVISISREMVQSEPVILITTCHPDNERINFKALAERGDWTEEALARRITDGLAAISKGIIEQNPNTIWGCYLSGGDVTASVCAVTCAKGIELKDEVLPLAAYGRLVGGYLDGIQVVTKGGMVGGKTAMDDCVRFLLNKLSNPSI